MAGLDTNVLVRWLMADDTTQTRQAQTLVNAATESGESLFVPITVSLELEWVLRSRYGLTRRDLVTTFTALLETRELNLEAEAALESALHRMRESDADFADALHAALCAAAGHEPLWTLDSKAARRAGAKLLTN